MTRRFTHCAGLLPVLFLFSFSINAQVPVAPSTGSNRGGVGTRLDITQFLAITDPGRRRDFWLVREAANPVTAPLNLTPTAAAAFSLQVLGGGTPGRLTKWAGMTSANSFIGDSGIYEDKFGNVGIGTDAPTSKLTVGGLIESFSGGFKFPDGTVQTTAALTSVSHDASLTGNGSPANPLGIALGAVSTQYLAAGAVTSQKIANGAVGTAQLADGSITESKITPGAVGSVELATGAVTSSKIVNGTVVRSLNNLTDNVSLAAGNNVTITPSGNTLTIAAAPSSIAVFTATNPSSGSQILTNPGQTVVSKDVPAGKYWISFRTDLFTIDSSDQDTACTLSTGGAGSFVRLLATNGSAELFRQVMVLNDTASFSAPTTISVHCVGFKATATGVFLTAIKVDSLQ